MLIFVNILAFLTCLAFRSSDRFVLSWTRCRNTIFLPVFLGFNSILILQYVSWHLELVIYVFFYIVVKCKYLCDIGTISIHNNFYSILYDLLESGVRIRTIFLTYPDHISWIRIRIESFLNCTPFPPSNWHCH